MFFHGKSPSFNPATPDATALAVCLEYSFICLSNEFSSLSLSWFTKSSDVTAFLVTPASSVYTVTSTCTPA